ncbi:TatD family hydrolase [Luminiphilus sp.]|nr:TatD family hydrolase [Luminiphilus sp.]MDC6472119.1 TatD family hydrolase [Luminiphilus sp.]
MNSTSNKTIPRFMTPIVETHCHLDYLDPESLRATLDAAADYGIERIVTIAVSPDNLETVRNLAAQNQQVWCTQGIHPHEASAWNQDVADRVIAGCDEERTVAVGEIGLDYHYDHSNRTAQARALDEQLHIAAQQNLPVVIHTRDADDDTRAILSNHSRNLTKKGVIHSFTSSLALAEFCLAEGFVLGFNGITTFKNAENVRAVVRATPAESIVLETDAPYLTPVPFRGKPNAPHYLPLIAEKLADLKGLQIEHFLNLTRKTSYQLFFKQ